MKKVFLLPLVLFLGLVVFLAVGLQRDPKEIPSPLVGKAAPAFKLFTLAPNGQTFEPKDMQGRVWILNVWATWCVGCQVEHPLLVEFSKQKNVPIVGLNYKEIQPQDEPPGVMMTPEDKLLLARQRSEKWLLERGNPYVVTAFDMDGRVGIDYGVYGIPETYVIDQKGVIRYKLVGTMTPEILLKKIVPLVTELQKT
jgi:cytochrome c biogenesis protein CcmG/thiol:disulfide interchange protein DsbE